MQKSKKILIFAPTLLRVKFFYNLHQQLLKDFDVVYITIKRSAENFLKSKDVIVYNLKSCDEAHLLLNEKAFFSNHLSDALLMDLKIGILKKERLEENYWFVIKRLYAIYKKIAPDYVFIFNGYAQYIEYSARVVSDFFGYQNIFFEIGNFPNKIFVDKKGVNTASSLMERDLTQIDCNLDKFLSYVENYLNNKEKQHFVPQGKVTINYLQKVLDHDRFEPSIVYRIKNAFDIFLKRDKITFDTLPPKEYLFFPLQVSHDSQILRFSKVDLHQAIKRASEDAQKNNLAFVVKPHPAEKNLDIVSYAKRYNAFIVNNNTYTLLKNASKVYTINSTVGLESFFYNKPLVVLGEAWYKKYIYLEHKSKMKVLCSYLNNILINGSYFDDNVQFDHKIYEYLKN